MERRRESYLIAALAKPGINVGVVNNIRKDTFLSIRFMPFERALLYIKTKTLLLKRRMS
jgi:hypothetical protein